MKQNEVKQILSDTAYVRRSSTAEEKSCAEYIRSLCEKMGFSAKVESFDITVHEICEERLFFDGREIPCKGYGGAANGTVCGRLHYLRSTDSFELKKCKDKIVLVDKGVGKKLCDDLIANGAKGYITYCGNTAIENRDISDHEIRFETASKSFLPAVNIHVTDAVEMVRKGGEVEIRMDQSARIGSSQNVILDFPGETEETVVVCAHYDSTSLSKGAYDNMSGCIALFYLAEYFAGRKNRRRVRLLWCGSEERGLHGSMEYCNAHKAELGNHVLNINLDMIGSLMGEFVAFSCANEKTRELLASFLKKHRFPATTRHAIRSSDSNSFVHSGVPAVSFARYATSSVVAVHTRFDTLDALSVKQLLQDSEIIAKFTDFVANEADVSLFSSISDQIRGEVAKYMEGRLPAVKKIFHE